MPSQPPSRHPLDQASHPANHPAPARLLIDGDLREASDGATFPVLDPATGRQIGQAPAGTEDDMAAAVGAARRAFDDTDWSTDLGLRVDCLRRLHAALVAEGESMRALTTAEAGVPTSLTTGPQYDLPVEGLRRVADLAEAHDWEVDLTGPPVDGVPSRVTLQNEPVGVVAAITSWDAPTQVALATIGPALAAGCTVVLKPAADTPWSACELGRIAAEILPPGVLNVVSTRDVDVAIGLTTDPRVDLVSFTGSSVVGQRVMTTAGAQLKRVVLQLGGRSAAVVLDDADLEEAVHATAAAVCVHAGQSATAPTRLVVPRARYDEAVAFAATTMASIGVGDPTDPATVCGPVVSPVQRDRIRRYLALAEAEGGTFATGGATAQSPTGGGFWVEPTVVAGLDNSSRVAREEIFGPVLVVIAHDGDDDAVRIANDSPYGLSASVHSGDVARARALARRLRVGSVSVNGGCAGPDAPLGGWKQSGVGTELGRAGLDAFLETRTVAVRT